MSAQLTLSSIASTIALALLCLTATAIESGVGSFTPGL